MEGTFLWTEDTEKDCIILDNSIQILLKGCPLNKTWMVGKSWKDQETGNNPSGRGKTTEAEPENWIQVGSSP